MYVYVYIYIYSHPMCVCVCVCVCVCTVCQESSGACKHKAVDFLGLAILQGQV